LFDGIFEVCDKRVVGETHIRLRLRPRATKREFPAIAFGAIDEAWVGEDGPIHAAYRLAVNDFRGTRSLQLIIEHAIPASGHAG